MARVTIRFALVTSEVPSAVFYDVPLIENEFSHEPPGTKCGLSTSTQRERIVESNHMWFIFVLTHVMSCKKLFNELNQLTKMIRVTYK